MTSKFRMRWLAAVVAGLCVMAVAPGAAGYAAASRGQARHDLAAAIPAGPAPPAATGSLSGVACVSAADCVAVGGVAAEFYDNAGVHSLAEHWNGTGWTPLGSPAGGSLSWVACLSARLCQAVGGGAAERWNGRAWIPEKTPAVRQASLNGVSCSAASACVAVGSRLAYPHYRTLAETWNGSAWAVHDPVNPRGHGNWNLSSVSCTRRSACIAVGYYQPSPGGYSATLAESWNGRTWTRLTLPRTAGKYAAALTGVSCVRSTRCVAVGFDSGSALAESWNGKKWTIMPAPPGQATAISCTATAKCMAVGGGSTESWNGSNWKALTTPPHAPYTLTLEAVSCPAAGRCMAVGGSADAGSFAMSWDGSAWRGVRVNRADLLSGVSCTRPTRCMATGSFVTASGRLVALTESWNGSSWRRHPASQIPGSVLSDVSCVSNHCVAVGAIGFLAALAEAWNGTAWRVTHTPSPGAPLAVSCRGVNCLAVGDFFSEEWNGAAWQAPVGVPGAPSQSSGRLTDVSCATPAYCMATGFYFTGEDPTLGPFSLAELWNGTNWQLLNPPGTGLTTVSCTSASFCMTAAGNTADIWDGISWRTRKLPGPFGIMGPGITAVSCTRPSACMAVGNYLAKVGSRYEGFNVAEYWNGTRWRRLATAGPGGGLTNVSCTSASRCMAVGMSPADKVGTHLLAERWNGSRWLVLATPNP